MSAMKLDENGHDRRATSPVAEAVAAEPVAWTDEQIIELAVAHSNYRETGANGTEFEVISHARLIAFSRALVARLQQEIQRLTAELAAFKEMYAREGAKALYELERAERAEAQLAETRKALEWHPIETAPLNTIVDLWCTYADAPASWGNDRPAGEIVHNRHKSKEHGWFGNESNDGIPQANGPDLVPVAWRWPAPEIPLKMMERFVAARRALAGGQEDG